MPTTASNFIRLAATVAGAASSVVLAYAPAGTSGLASVLGGTFLDKYAVDLSKAGYAKNGAAYLALSASTPVTLDLTALGTGATASAGDTSFATVNELIFNNTGATDVIISAGASNGFAGPLAGTTPTFTVPAGAKTRWHSPAGYTVDGTHKTLKFDPGGSAATIGFSVGGL